MRLKRAAILILVAVILAPGLESAKPKKKSRVAKPRTESKADLQRQQKAAQQEITETKRKIVQNDKAVSKNLAELNRIQGDIAVSRQQVNTSRQQVNTLHGRIRTLEKGIAAGEKELARLRNAYLKSVKAIRAKKGSNSTLVYLFSSGSLGEARRRMRYLREFREWRDKHSGEIKAQVKTLNDRKQQLTDSKRKHDKALATQLAAQRNLEQQYQQKDAIVVELKANGTALKKHLSRKQAEANMLRNRVASLIAAEQAAAEKAAAEKRDAEKRAAELAAAEKRAREQEELRQQQTKEQAGSRDVAERDNRKNQADSKKDKIDNRKNRKTEKGKSKSKNKGDYAEARRRRPRNTPSSTPAPASSTSASGPKPSAPAPAASGFAAMQGSLPRPVNGYFRVTSRFGVHALPDLPDVKYDNPGIDAEVASGASAIAVYAGKVSGVYMIPGYSTVVIVNHGNYYTVYGNLASASVKVGDMVRQGQSVGHVGDNPDNPGHGQIHFEVWKNRVKQDPMAWIR